MKHRAEGQATLEYITMFALVAGATILTLTTWDNTVRASMEQLFTQLVGKMQ